MTQEQEQPLLTFGEDGGLARQLLQHLGRPGEPVPALPHADVEAELADAQLPHRVLLLNGVLLRRNDTGADGGSPGDSPAVTPAAGEGPARPAPQPDTEPCSTPEPSPGAAAAS